VCHENLPAGITGVDVFSGSRIRAFMAKKRRRRRKGKRYHTGVHMSPKTSVGSKYRSGWELLFMMYLDADPDVVEWAYEGVSIPYVSNAKSRRIRKYLPDFYVVRTDRKQLVEVKPSRKLAHATVQKKLAAAREWCAQKGVELLVITELNLVQMGLM
jgi:hypothetical protein